MNKDRKAREEFKAKMDQLVRLGPQEISVRLGRKEYLAYVEIVEKKGRLAATAVMPPTWH